MNFSGVARDSISPGGTRVPMPLTAHVRAHESFLAAPRGFVQMKLKSVITLLVGAVFVAGRAAADD
jgi:hypothetical protein